MIDSEVLPTCVKRLLDPDCYVNVLLILAPNRTSLRRDLKSVVVFLLLF